MTLDFCKFKRTVNNEEVISCLITRLIKICEIIFDFIIYRSYKVISIDYIG